MSKRTKIEIIKWLTYVFVMTLMYSIQSTPNFITINGVSPNLVFCFGVFLAITLDQHSAVFVGAILGLFLDFNGSNIIGFSSMVLMLLFFVSSFLQQNYLKYKLQNSILILVCNLFIYSIIFHLIYYIIWYEVPFYMFFIDSTIQFIYTILLSFPIYIFTNFLNTLFKNEEVLDA